MCKSRSVLESRSGAVLPLGRDVFYVGRLIVEQREKRMYWTTPTLVEICVGLEINGYLPAEF
jgi:coenzyme PQQ precursor peptide PqqA